LHSPEELVRIFREKGLRVTPQRRKIMSLLAESDMHPSADDIYEQVIIDMPDVSRATIYNTLSELVNLGEIHEVENINGASTRYDPLTELHHHLYCERCHKLVDIKQLNPPFEIPTELTSGFDVKRSQITFYGVCSECQALER
jgi:Fe2+ or Zn2+ uptake regulation protein